MVIDGGTRIDRGRKKERKEERGRRMWGKGKRAEK